MRTMAYPITCVFKIPATWTKGSVYYRFKESDLWSAMPEKESDEFFNGITACRFDFTDHKVYISTRFSDSSSEIYLKAHFAAQTFTYPLRYGANVYSMSVVGNSPVSDFNFSSTGKQISYFIANTEGTNCFSNVTIPKKLMNGDFNVLLDNRPVTYKLNHNASSVSLYFSYANASHIVRIEATRFAEFPSSLFIALLTGLVLIVVTPIIIKRSAGKRIHDKLARCLVPKTY